MNRCLTIALGLTGLVSAAAAGTLRQAQNLVVVDSLGQTLGVVQATDLKMQGGEMEGTRMAFTYDGVVFSTLVSAQGFVITSTKFYYQSPDCTGTRYLPGADYLGDLPVVASPGQTVYVRDQSVPAAAMTMHSTGGHGYCETSNISMPFRPAKALVNMLDHFTPPFRYQSGCDNACDHETVAGGVIRLGEVEK